MSLCSDQQYSKSFAVKTSDSKLEPVFEVSQRLSANESKRSVSFERQPPSVNLFHDYGSFVMSPAKKY